MSVCYVQGQYFTEFCVSVMCTVSIFYCSLCLYGVYRVIIKLQSVSVKYIEDIIVLQSVSVR